MSTGSGHLVLVDIGIPRIVCDRFDVAYDPFGREWWVELATD